MRVVRASVVLAVAALGAAPTTALRAQERDFSKVEIRTEKRRPK
jgi:hypothetical protein